MDYFNHNTNNKIMTEWILGSDNKWWLYITIGKHIYKFLAEDLEYSGKFNEEDIRNLLSSMQQHTEDTRQEQEEVPLFIY